MNKRLFRAVLIQAIFYFFLLLLWQILFILKIWPEYLFPSPIKVFWVIINGFSDHTFITAILVSLRRVLTGFGISIFLGAILGKAQEK